jgi:hypothetical protein
MTLWRHGKIVLLTFELRQAMVVTHNGEAVQPRLDGIESGLWFLSNDGDGSYRGGGPSRSSWDRRLGTGGITDVAAR